MAVGMGVTIGIDTRRNSSLINQQTTTKAVKFVSSIITADGTVTAQSQATLNFQTSGKLTRLPLKEGDKIQTGQIPPWGIIAKACGIGLIW